MSISYEEGIKTKNCIHQSNKKVVSLQVPSTPPSKKNSCKEWMSLCASLTIEAVFSLLLFLFASLSLIYPLYIMGMQGQIQQALEIVGDELTQASYLAQDLDADSHVTSILSIIYAKNRVISILNQEKIDTSFIKGGDLGLSFLGSSILADQRIVDLVVGYKMKMPFPFFMLDELSFVQRSRRQGWVGAEVKVIAEHEILVYVTDHGTVYHKSLSCRHLKVIIQKISMKQIASKRNESGGKYYLCEVCKTGDVNGSLYITPYGNRYHTSSSCRELSISINSMPMSKVSGRTSCKSCYKE